jgi:hypothetical protein
MTTVLAIDPGSERSAWLVLKDDRPTVAQGMADNADLVRALRLGCLPTGLAGLGDVVVIEQIESYGMAVGREVFDTVWWSGRFAEAARPTAVVQLPRRAVKLALCADSRAKDTNIRQALLDRFGGKAAAVGRKAAPGPLYGISGDVWSALAIAVTYADGEAAGGPVRGTAGRQRVDDRTPREVYDYIDDAGRFPAERSEG